MPYFHFTQNNSGGWFDLTDELTHHVIIEANTPEQANDILVSLGGYFDGCHFGVDCDCCGDRWYPLWPDDRGNNMPMIYNQPVSTRVAGSHLPAGRNAVVHHMDGRVEWF